MKSPSIAAHMECDNIPQTPPPPYQTLPPTPALSTVSTHAAAQTTYPHAHQHQHQHENERLSHSQETPDETHYPHAAQHTWVPAYGTAPRNSYAYPQQPYHTHLMSLPYRPIDPYGHAVSYYHSVHPAYCAHTGGNPTPPQHQCRIHSFLKPGAISATLNDAGNLATEVYSALVNPRSTREEYSGVMSAVGLRLDDVLTSIDDGTFKVNSADTGRRKGSLMIGNRKKRLSNVK